LRFIEAEEKITRGDEVCNWLYDIQTEITPQFLEMKAEALKLYNCKFSEQFRKDVNSIFNKEKLHSVTDYYLASIINRNLEENRFDESGFRPILAEKVQNDILKKFKPETFTLGDSKGVTMETVRLV